ncbi:hypothetical protein [Kitasatospora sp. GP82]|uniref:hypothetical protein n=1 Tax=Kitasatospora sp. GP82 TaxID=3035089 RepID=UPI00247622FE|nr:hypothetical protein [Kitasatospora sp. GP82]MDH6129610.1 hypothetical protein [Kitasatospora sp. GP82]
MRKVQCGDRDQAGADLPCILDFGHQDDHLTALGGTWPRVPRTRCCRCGAETDDPVPVTYSESTSSSGFSRWTCPACATKTK